MPADPKRVRDVFLAAAELPAGDRAAYLSANAGDDAELRVAVERLLAAHEQPAPVLLRPAPGVPTADFAPIAERVGTKIGPYKLMEQIGEGGFGLVFVAEQTEPVRRKVALKVIKPGMDSSQVIARFQAERQALAMMDHPNIARVLDAGATDSGRPYFVMELVRGIPITAYCDQNHLPPRERLELFVSVCHAIQHAHQKGVIHRDIKPSNVLVTSHDGKPVAKVIDFGVAKSIHQPLTERTIYTNFAQMIGTPLYMSPEQAEMSGLDIDTRSDIYSLGVLLYELLTGSTPLSRKQLREASYAEILRLICEEEPEKPSTRLSHSGEALPALALRRKTEPAKLSKLLRGELDWIVMKCLEKDRTRRYDTANGLARDVQRYLADEAVEACPPSTGYRLGKFARKHKKAFATAAAFVVLLAGAAFVSGALAVRATRAEANAVQAWNEEAMRRREADEQRQRAEENERQAKAVLAFFQAKVLAAGSPERTQGGQGKDVTLRQVLDAAVPEIAKAFRDQPLVEASIREVLGQSYSNQGDYASAVQQFEQVRALRQAKLGIKHPDTLFSMHKLAESYGFAGKHDSALPLAEETLKQQRATLGPEHLDTLKSMLTLAVEYRAAGKLDEALPLFEETFALRKATLGSKHVRTLNAMIALGGAYQEVGKLDQALAVLNDAVKLAKAHLGPEDWYTRNAMRSLGEVYREAGQLDQALALLEETFKLEQAKLGPEHPRAHRCMLILARAYDTARQYPKALRLGQELLALQRRKLPANDPMLAETLTLLGLSQVHAQQPAAAEPLLRECLAIRQKHKADHWMTFQAQSLLGASLLGQQKNAEAEPLLRQGYEGMKQRAAKMPANAKVHLTEALERLVQLYEATGQKDKADTWRKKREEAKGQEKK
jgi:serine/threonine protein kinase/tetratricopeptide (TPR) repeat protein